MGRKEPAKDEELNEEERAWREIHDPEKTLNLNQIHFRVNHAKEDAKRRAENKARKEKERIEAKAKKLAEKMAKEEQKETRQEQRDKEKAKLERQKLLHQQDLERTRQAQATLQARHAQQQAEKAGEGGDVATGMSLEEYVRKAQSLSGQATIEDLLSILHARLVMTSHNLELTPRDYMSALRMLREIQDQNAPKTEEDPYEVEPMAPEDLTERTTEVLMVYLRLWETQHAMEVRWLEPILRELLHCVFLNQPLPKISGVRWLIEMAQPFFGAAIAPPPTPETTPDVTPGLLD
jgi:hypothetical protein